MTYILKKLNQRVMVKMRKNSLLLIFHLIGSFYLIQTSQIQKFVLILLLQGIFIFFEYKNSKGDVFIQEKYFVFYILLFMFLTQKIIFNSFLLTFYMMLGIYLTFSSIISFLYFKREKNWYILFASCFCIFYIIWSNNFHRRFKNLYEFRWVLLFYLLYLFIFVMFLIKKEYRTKESTYWYN